MKLPAIRARIGDWCYYISKMKFQEINERVKRIDDELHKSKTLSDQIQRSITNNYKKIKDYIISQDERFFNSLVLAVYDGNPQWIEVEINFEDEEFFNIGFLQLNGEEKIFPVDGQHRVEGIKSVLIDNPELKDEEIAVIFIGHNKNDEGMKRSRRLFTTLNRYAKPVTMDDLIALDEDDSAAIATRHLVENFSPFQGKRIIKSSSKRIDETDKTSFTSLITLYQCNKELLKLFRKHRKMESPNKQRDLLSLSDYLKFRPEEKEIVLFQDFLEDFWNCFISNFKDVNNYFTINEEEFPAKHYRSRENGGNLLFRPVGIFPTIQAIIEIKNRTEYTYERIIRKLDNINFNLDVPPWRNVLWNPSEKTMIMGKNNLVKQFLIFTFDKSLQKKTEYTKLQQQYSDSIGIDFKESKKTLNQIIKSYSK